jgi:hypothetical protein
LDDVASLKIQYMDPVSKSFQDVWPATQSQVQTGGANGAPTTPPPGGASAQQQIPPGSTTATADAVNSSLPVAVNIVITLKDLGDITRVVEVSSCGSNCLP